MPTYCAGCRNELTLNIQEDEELNFGDTTIVHNGYKFSARARFDSEWCGHLYHEHCAIIMIVANYILAEEFNCEARILCCANGESIQQQINNPRNRDFDARNLKARLLDLLTPEASNKLKALLFSVLAYEMLDETKLAALHLINPSYPAKTDAKMTCQTFLLPDQPNQPTDALAGGFYGQCMPLVELHSELEDDLEKNLLISALADRDGLVKLEQVFFNDHFHAVTITIQHQQKQVVEEIEARNPIIQKTMQRRRTKRRPIPRFESRRPTPNLDAWRELGNLAEQHPWNIVTTTYGVLAMGDSYLPPPSATSARTQAYFEASIFVTCADTLEAIKLVPQAESTDDFIWPEQYPLDPTPWLIHLIASLKPRRSSRAVSDLTASSQTLAVETATAVQQHNEAAWRTLAAMPHWQFMPTEVPNSHLVKGDDYKLYSKQQRFTQVQLIEYDLAQQVVSNERWREPGIELPDPLPVLQHLQNCLRDNTASHRTSTASSYHDTPSPQPFVFTTFPWDGTPSHRAPTTSPHHTPSPQPVVPITFSDDDTSSHRGPMAASHHHSPSPQPIVLTTFPYNKTSENSSRASSPDRQPLLHRLASRRSSYSQSETSFTTMSQPGSSRSGSTSSFHRLSPEQQESQFRTRLAVENVNYSNPTPQGQPTQPLLGTTRPAVVANFGYSTFATSNTTTPIDFNSEAMIVDDFLLATNYLLTGENPDERPWCNAYRAEHTRYPPYRIIASPNQRTARAEIIFTEPNHNTDYWLDESPAINLNSYIFDDVTYQRFLHNPQPFVKTRMVGDRSRCCCLGACFGCCRQPRRLYIILLILLLIGIIILIVLGYTTLGWFNNSNDANPLDNLCAAQQDTAIAAPQEFCQQVVARSIQGLQLSDKTATQLRKMAATMFNSMSGPDFINKGCPDQGSMFNIGVNNCAAGQYPIPGYSITEMVIRAFNSLRAEGLIPPGYQNNMTNLTHLFEQVYRILQFGVPGYETPQLLFYLQHPEAVGAEAAFNAAINTLVSYMSLR